jgi:hypothetical protein
LKTAKSIISGQSTFLKDPRWKTVPWEDDPTSKLPIDYLVDIGADIAECIAKIKAFNDSSASLLHCQVISEYTALKSQVASSIEELNMWWCWWEVSNANCAIEIAPSSPDKTPFVTLLQFDSLWQAFTVSTYAAMRILLLQLWHYLLQHAPPSLPLDIDFVMNPEEVVLDVPNTSPLLGITASTQALAAEILRTFSYCYGCTSRFVTTVSFLFIQDVAYGCFPPESEEAKWAARHGWADFLHNSRGSDVRDENLLNRLVPLGQTNIEGLVLGTVGEPLGFGSL